MKAQYPVQQEKQHDPFKEKVYLAQLLLTCTAASSRETFSWSPHTNMLTGNTMTERVCYTFTLHFMAASTSRHLKKHDARGVTSLHKERRWLLDTNWNKTYKTSNTCQIQRKERSLFMKKSAHCNVFNLFLVSSVVSGDILKRLKSVESLA